VRHDGERTILLTSHEHLFLALPRGFSPNLVIVDEGLGGRMTRQALVKPETLSHRPTWIGYGDGPELAGKVDAALRQTGRELAELRAAGVTAADLETAATWLRERFGGLRAAVEVAESDAELEQALAAAEGARHRAVAALLEGLAIELAHERDGANGCRLELRKVEKRLDDGSTEWAEEERFVARGVRRWRIKESAAVVMVDATANRDLVERWLGAPVRYMEHVIPLLGTIVQVRDVTYSKYGLLHRAEAANNRARLAAMIRDAYRLSGGSLFVCATAEVEHALRTELADLAGVVWMHYGAERGSDAAKGCRVGVVVGREQPDVRAIEDMARGFAVERAEPFVPAGIGRGGRRDLAPAVRGRLVRNASTVMAETTTHPDLLGRAVLEQVREASVVQAAGRLRMAREPGKLLILATSLPVGVEVDRLVDRHELESAVWAAAGMAGELAEHGAAVATASREAGRRAERFGAVAADAASLLSAAGPFAHERYKTLYQPWAKVRALPAKVPTKGRPGKAWVLSALPPAEAFAAARVAGHDVEPAVPLPAPAKERPEMAPEMVRRSGAGGTIRLEPVMRGEGGPLRPAREEPTMPEYDEDVHADWFEQQPPDDLDTHPERYMPEMSAGRTGRRDRALHHQARADARARVPPLRVQADRERRVAGRHLLPAQAEPVQRRVGLLAPATPARVSTSRPRRRVRRRGGAVHHHDDTEEGSP
jgi:hypothetical protein